jgi:sulfur-oxidizing protein SoxB
VREIRVGGRPLEDERWYTIAACEREGEEADTLCRIPRVQDHVVLEIDGHEAVRRYLAKRPPIRAPEPGRVVALDRPPVQRSQFEP